MIPVPVTFHLGGIEPMPGVSIGSPMYGTPAEHLPALLLLAASPVVALLIRTVAPRSALAARILGGYRARPPLHRLAAWLLAASAVLHLGMWNHHEGVMGILVVGDGLLLGAAAGLLLLGRIRAGPGGAC